DAEIAGQPDVSVKSNEPKTLWKRYTFSNAGEPMEYLAVTTYNNGAVQTILFELKSDVVPTPDPADQYTTLSRGTKSDAVLDLQKQLIELGYLSGKADGSYGEKTQTAVTKAQKDFGMEENGTATPDFQVRLFAETAKPAATESPEDAAEADAN
ncbi:MAG: peptidoglycan-binding protein, partial [Clostridia bacterium]|nr:peptidoglycan-binding protein [Clostridia bacterium]